ncbi:MULTISPECIES: lipid-A-disaccharide synthase [Psychrobacter]|uniref:lipid-A-disaccharide synthase n=1 Tax=Psychrobacter TaxID=497 RepID=UPI000C31BA0E|nr:MULTISPECIES: lipid-A-disaccharide synthase [Psychrobacter]MBA6243193.1 lipid-A-disaccharide synthase [Psychrobacter sp. Urea-trap-18]MBA6286251.1 lipid-A-disaccharide synthase [Psychrobacter sp. Urea-trap-16]MBA6317400.1 lipid-A-disaccharide synthase [Psychrobacter sp. Urea-trap-20]MBA6334572.1 lipid-A-disaccharide synthase [Psychrobacter sp. Urea-trap-19]PKG60884.1 lipid-A-disaccharide synthase [Psychrobacter sp. Choline-3u-12]
MTDSATSHHHTDLIHQAETDSQVAKINATPLVIGIVAGEVSGDSLGADFMRQMNNLRDDIVWVGVGGTKMHAQGLQSIFPLERLAVMGLVEVMSQLPDLLKARRELLSAFKAANIDWFVGIDAPDFNLRVSKKLKPQGVFCVQYVSPSIWAWRESRIHNIKAATNLVLCLFPFELPVYERHNHPAICVGHPLLRTIDQNLIDTPINQRRSELVWDNDGLQQFFIERFDDVSQLICVMPGSRRGEITAILPLMLDGIQKLILLDPKLCFIIPTVDQNHQYIVQEVIDQRSEQLREAIVVVYDDTQPEFSQHAMAASDIVMLASGTATLEAMLLERPMVVVYQLNQLTYQIAKRLVKVPYVALPNILANAPIVPELIQEQASGDNICRTVMRLLQPRAYAEQLHDLLVTKQSLQQQSNHEPANSVIEQWFIQNTDTINPN